jgi:(4S)-4-hydroxy-5-phosphonooxypentane-2,3-dione isomerase
MVILQVELYVKPEYVDAFKAATIQNGNESRQESGNLRFELLEDSTNPTRFMLTEIYLDEAAMNVHFNSPHFQEWRAAVAGHFVADGQPIRYTPVFPSPTSWR